MQTESKLKKAIKAEDESTGDVDPVHIRLYLTGDCHSEIDQFTSKHKARVIKLFKKRPTLGVSTICQALIEIMLSDKELQKRVEERLLEKLNAKTK